MNKVYVTVLFLSVILSSCSKEEDKSTVWKRDTKNPVLRDILPDGSYEVASDAQVFLDQNGDLKMIYTGAVNDQLAIKLAIGTTWNSWVKASPLVFEVGSSKLDSIKETGFYRKTSTGKHQIYYIGYNNENTYQSQVFLAEADNLTGPYTQIAQPVVPRGILAGKNVYCITSPSVVEHEGLLYMSFLGWDAVPQNVTEIWTIGATSSDNGHTWSDFKLVKTPIGMEGQLTKVANGKFIAVRTGDYGDKEAVFYSTAAHPFGPWTETPEPIVVQAGLPYEKDEIIAPQITVDPATDNEYLYYTGADHSQGWWIMLAQKTF